MTAIKKESVSYTHLVPEDVLKRGAAMYAQFAFAFLESKV